MEDTLTITLNDKVAKQLRKIIPDEVSTKKLDMRNTDGLKLGNWNGDKIEKDEDWCNFTLTRKRG